MRPLEKKMTQEELRNVLEIRKKSLRNENLMRRTTEANNHNG